MSTHLPHAYPANVCHRGPFIRLLVCFHKMFPGYCMVLWIPACKSKGIYNKEGLLDNQRIFHDFFLAISIFLQKLIFISLVIFVDFCKTRNFIIQKVHCVFAKIWQMETLTPKKNTVFLSNFGKMGPRPK